MTAWEPGDPWPSGTTGGASSPHWGPYVRLWIRAALAAGRPFTMGQHDNDRLDAGNVLGGGAPLPRVGEGERLWVDLTCDVLDVNVTGGASSSDGILSQPSAATLVATLADPEGIYDPLNRNSPFAYGGHSRLVPGTPVEAFAEIVNADDGSWSRRWLFTGTADSWGEDWTPSPSRRQAKLVASDATKQWAKFNRPEQPEQGAGDTITARVNRLITFYEWLGTVEHDPDGGTVTLQATTLAQTGWELLNRVLDDELGYVYFTSEGALRWVNRDTWSERGDPVLVLGCGEGFHDVLLDASPSAIDTQIRNAIYAARTGGTTVTAISESSIARYGFTYDYKRTDLGLADDVQVGAWASALLTLYAYPQVAIDDVTMRPAIDPESWLVYDAVLGIEYVSDLVRIVWAPPDRPDDVIDGLVRVVGHTHKITRAAWETRWQVVGAQSLSAAGFVFTMGPHAQDRLDAGFVLGG